jgi:putative oxidoreductase
MLQHIRGYSMLLLAPASTRQLDLGLTILRAITGLIFVAHGGQKLFVYGFAGVAAAFGQMGVPLAGIMGPLVAVLEFFGGIALIAGLMTRLVSVGLTLTMVGAILLVHLAGGFFMPTGIEFTLSLLGSALLLALTGAGAYSLDAVLARRRASSVTMSAAAEPGTRRAA